MDDSGESECNRSTRSASDDTAPGRSRPSHRARVRGVLLGGIAGAAAGRARSGAASRDLLLATTQALVDTAHPGLLALDTGLDAGLDTGLDAGLDTGLDEGGPVTDTSKSCDGLLGAAPFGLLLTSADADDTVELTHVYELAYASAARSNSHPTSKIAAGALAMLVARLCGGAELRAAVIATATHVGLKPGADDVIDAIGAALGATYGHEPPLATVEALGTGGAADSALAIALYAALVHAEAEEVADALALATAHPGDAATTGAVCGSILGALHGDASIPADLLAAIDDREAVEALADALAVRALSTNRHPDA